MENIMDMVVDTEWEAYVADMRSKLTEEQWAEHGQTFMEIRKPIFDHMRAERLQDEQKTIEMDDALIQIFRSQKEKRFEILADGSGIMVGPDDYILVGALSGQGKSTFGLQSVCHAIANGRKALYISAEEGEAQILENMNSMLESMLTKDQKHIIPRLRSLSCRLIGPRRSNDAVFCFDLVLDVVKQEVKHFQPDLIVLDNLNVMVIPGLPHHKTDKRFTDGMAKQKIDYLSTEIYKLINKESGFPPIIALQQLKVNGVPGYKSASSPGLMQSHLADTSKTLKDCTLALMIMRDIEANTSLIHLGKNRDMRGRRIPQVSTWSMEPDKNILSKHATVSNPWLNQKDSK